LFIIIAQHVLSSCNAALNPFARIRQKASCLISPFIFITSISSISATSATALETKQYTNDRYQTSLLYPSDWIEKYGILSNERNLIAFTDPKDSDTSLSIVFTPIPADYARLNSFGGKETLRQYVLPKGDGVSTNVLNEVIKGESYLLEYVISAPNQPTRHVQSIFALKPQDAVVGLNIQTKEETFAVNKEKFDVIFPSLKVE
jgi:hypothetical protein